jgi:hypothetical protein
MMANTKTNEAAHPQKLTHHQKVNIMLVAVVLTILVSPSN